MTGNGRSIAAFAVALCSAAGPASADHVLEFAEPRLIDAMGAYARAYADACASGSGAHCIVLHRIGVEAHILLSAGYACQWQNDVEACALYRDGIGRFADDLATLRPGAVPASAAPGWVETVYVEVYGVRPDLQKQSDDLLGALLTPKPELSTAEQHELFLDQLRD